MVVTFNVIMLSVVVPGVVILNVVVPSSVREKRESELDKEEEKKEGVIK
jgi:hypothetical protein